jgi:choline-sulfatase
MNILWILEDALRPDHMGCYGYAKNTTPHCDRLAREGVRFETVVSTASHTLPPIVSMLMSQWSATHGVVDPATFVPFKAGGWADVRTPLHMLRDEGYLIDGELVMRWAPLGFERDTPSDGIEQYFEDHRDDKWFFYAEPYPTHLPYNPRADYYEMFLDDGLKAGADQQRRLDVVKSFLIVNPGDCIS